MLKVSGQICFTALFVHGPFGRITEVVCRLQALPRGNVAASGGAGCSNNAFGHDSMHDYQAAAGRASSLAGE
jgi:hypothetical protein